MLSIMNPPPHSQLASTQPDYYSFLLRVWQTPQGWRASLDDTPTGRRLGFASLEQLFAHLMQLTEGEIKTDRT